MHATWEGIVKKRLDGKSVWRRVNVCDEIRTSQKTEFKLLFGDSPPRLEKAAGAKPIRPAPENVGTPVFLPWRAFGCGFWEVELWKRHYISTGWIPFSKPPVVLMPCWGHHGVLVTYPLLPCVATPCSKLGERLPKNSDSTTCKKRCNLELRKNRWIKGSNSYKIPALPLVRNGR